jgi:hypothetical protein
LRKKIVGIAYLSLGGRIRMRSVTKHVFKFVAAKKQKAKKEKTSFAKKTGVELSTLLFITSIIFV